MITLSEISSGLTPISTTYTNLVTLKNSSSLQPGAKYLIDDFQTIYDQPDYTGNLPVTPQELKNAVPKTVVATKTGPVEPLIVTAATTSALLPDAISTSHPKDQIKFDITFTNTEVMNAPAKGRIIERIDEWNNRTDYDHRHIFFKRYKENPSSSAYTIFYDTGNASSEFLTFDLSLNTSTVTTISNNYIDDNLDKNISHTTFPFLLANNVFISNINSQLVNNKVSTDCTNNTCVFDIFVNNNIKSKFKNNVLNSENFSENNIDSEFMYNMYYYGSNVFYANNIGMAFTGNTISNMFFSNNDISRCYHLSNTSRGFINNIIDNVTFYANTIEGNFIDNTFATYGLLFVQNVIKFGFFQNYIKRDFGKNNIGTIFQKNETNEFYNNTIGNYCVNNKFNGRFTNNTVGNYCGTADVYSNPNYSNTFGSADSNTLGNNIWNNGIGNDFNNNKIGDYFGYNTIGSYFTDNQIGNYFGINESNTNGANTILWNFQRNVIGVYFCYNSVSNGFQDNQIGNYCGTYSNDPHGNNINTDTFQRNVIGNYFCDNTIVINTNFIENNIKNSFANNTLNTRFKRNNIDNQFTGNSCNIFENNIIGDQFRGNSINYAFYDNTVGYLFWNNDILGPCGYNRIGNLFGDYDNFNPTYKNIIAGQFNNNIIGDGFGFKRAIGVSSINNISDYFENNTIGNNFYGITTGTGFNNNQIANEIQNINFTPATHVYQTYNCNISKASNGNNYLQYINGTPAIVLVSPTS